MGSLFPRAAVCAGASAGTQPLCRGAHASCRVGKRGGTKFPPGAFYQTPLGGKNLG